MSLFFTIIVFILIAFRYIRSKRQEGFISIIAWFSLIGISLGVATLIIVMSVMNGFRIELVDRILGINGHLGIYSSAQNRIVEYNNTVLKVSNINGVLAVVPQIEEQVMIISKKGSNESRPLVVTINCSTSNEASSSISLRTPCLTFIFPALINFL